jgi:hypothetical protein
MLAAASSLASKQQRRSGVAVALSRPGTGFSGAVCGGASVVTWVSTRSPPCPARLGFRRTATRLATVVIPRTPTMTSSDTAMLTLGTGIGCSSWRKGN